MTCCDVGAAAVGATEDAGLESAILPLLFAPSSVPGPAVRPRAAAPTVVRLGERPEVPQRSRRAALCPGGGWSPGRAARLRKLTLFFFLSQEAAPMIRGRTYVFCRLAHALVLAFWVKIT